MVALGQEGRTRQGGNVDDGGVWGMRRGVATAGASLPGHGGTTGRSPLWTLWGEGSDPATLPHGQQASTSHGCESLGDGRGRVTSPRGVLIPRPCWSECRDHPGAGKRGGTCLGTAPREHGQEHGEGQPERNLRAMASVWGRGWELATSQGHRKGCRFLRDPEPSHRGLTACLKGPDAFGAATAVPQGLEKTNSGKFSLLSHGKSRGRPHVAAVNHHHTLPAARAGTGMGTAMAMCPRRQPRALPCSPAAAGLTVRPMTRVRVLPCRVGSSTLSPAARLDVAPAEDVAMPGSIPAPGQAVGWARASGVRGGSRPCGCPHTRGRRGVGEWRV